MLYFILGYLFYAAVFIAAGSPFNTEQEAQQVTSYLVLFLILPIVLAIPAMKDPGAAWIKVLSFIPLLDADDDGVAHSDPDAGMVGDRCHHGLS